MGDVQRRMWITAMVLILAVFCVVFAAGASGGGYDVEDDHKPQIPERAASADAEEEPEEMSVLMPLTEEDVIALDEPESLRQYVYYDVPLNDEFQEYIQDVCDAYGFQHYDVVVALIKKESTFRETVISKTNDYGYMQINSINHEWLSDELGISDFLDGEQNVLAGVHILSGLYRKYGDMELALMAYNCGEKGASDLWKREIFSTAYTREILGYAAELEVRQ